MFDRSQIPKRKTFLGKFFRLNKFVNVEKRIIRRETKRCGGRSSSTLLRSSFIFFFIIFIEINWKNERLKWIFWKISTKFRIQRIYHRRKSETNVVFFLFVFLIDSSSSSGRFNRLKTKFNRFFISIEFNWFSASIFQRVTNVKVNEHSMANRYIEHRRIKSSIRIKE